MTIRMRQALSAFLIGGIFVAAAELINRADLAAPATFLVLLPGIVAGCMSPDAACGAEGDLHPPGALAVFLQIALNMMFYGGAVYLLMTVVSKFRRRQPGL